MLDHAQAQSFLTDDFSILRMIVPDAMSSAPDVVNPDLGVVLTFRPSSGDPRGMGCPTLAC